MTSTAAGAHVPTDMGLMEQGGSTGRQGKEAGEPGARGAGMPAADALAAAQSQVLTAP